VEVERAKETSGEEGEKLKRDSQRGYQVVLEDLSGNEKPTSSIELDI
jgi:hypothetical protein